MKIAVIGSGGREHALWWALSRSRSSEDVVALPGNPGIPNRAPVDLSDAANVVRACRELQIELAVVGPEAPLAAGLVDQLRAAGVAAFGPTREAARLESSKVFAKGFMARHGVATAEAWAFGPGEDPTQAVDACGGLACVKFDGLAAGKGVWVCGGREESLAAVSALRARFGSDSRFLIERRLFGDEVSVIGFTDGRDFRWLPVAQDHKALGDGDTGPNTGGMGAIAPVPQVDSGWMARIEREVVQPTLRGIQAERLDYRGFLYFGLMLTTDGPRLLEYNVRLGDPEAEVMLPLLETDLAEVLFACLEQRLGALRLSFSPGAAASVVLAARGYPETPEKGREITGLDGLAPGILAFQCGTRGDGTRLLTDGGRVLNLVARGPNLDAALESVYRAVPQVHFEGMQFRTDIGRRPWRLASNA